MKNAAKKWAVITAGTKGIGKALVEKFSQEGFSILTCSRNSDDLAALQKAIVESGASAPGGAASVGANSGVECKIMKADLSVAHEVSRFAEFCLRSAPQTDVLINNAGIYLPGQIHSEPDGALEKMIETNLYSAYHLTRKLIGPMMARRKGHLFNICSTASITPYVNGGSYCISKYALHGMTKVLREEMKPHGVRVTSVIPGATRTASWEGTTLPDERFMKAEDVAAAVWAAYALSDQAVVEELVLRPQLGDLG
ncbi:MAG: SDR family oxidoreductase [Methylotenera sp.]|nr:SDR family oxidoreductase [Oligoflexia bacterium]